MKRFASVQASSFRLEAIADDVVHLDGGRYRAVLEVGGRPFDLLGAREREALLAGYAGWLNSLAYPVQVLVRVTPLDLDGYVGALERRALAALAPPLRPVAADHAAFLRRLAHERTLLERRCYVVVPAGEDDGRLPRWPFARRPPAMVAEAARRLLTARCEETARGLGRCGLATRRLGSLELAQLFHACWRPEGARVQRLRAELVEATARARPAPPDPERSA